MKGYLDSSLDAEAFDEDGWFQTGDLGRIDADGMVTITGRVKDIIIRNMENISAKEVEDLLFTPPRHRRRRRDRRARPDAPASGCARSSCRRTRRRRPTLGVGGRVHAREQGLMTQKLPEQLEVVDALPRNPTGKVLKFELKDRFGG